jgi:hypothetical protein
MTRKQIAAIEDAQAALDRVFEAIPDREPDTGLPLEHAVEALDALRFRLEAEDAEPEPKRGAIIVSDDSAVVIPQGAARVFREPGR